MMKKQWFAALMATAAVVGLSACSKSASSATGANDSVIRIASGSPLSGGQAAAGKDFANGAQLAVDEINAKGGIEVAGKKYTLELVPEDDQGDPKTGATVAQKIVDDKSIVAVIGHYNSGVTMVANSIYAKGNRAALTVSTNPDVIRKAPKLADGATSIFRMDAHDGMQGPALAVFAQKKGVKKLAILDDATAYGKGLGDQVANKAKELGMDVGLRESATDKTVDFKAILTKVKAAGADAIMWGGYDDTGAILSKQARELGLYSCSCPMRCVPTTISNWLAMQVRAQCVRPPAYHWTIWQAVQALEPTTTSISLVKWCRPTHHCRMTQCTWWQKRLNYPVRRTTQPKSQRLCPRLKFKV